MHTDFENQSKLHVKIKSSKLCKDCEHASYTAYSRSQCQKWLMCMQPSKCEALCISNKHCHPTFTYYLCDDKIFQWSCVVRTSGNLHQSALDMNRTLQVCQQQLQQSFKHVSPLAVLLLALCKATVFLCSFPFTNLIK